MPAVMKTLKRCVRIYYSVEKRTCREQLQDDFCDFPPNPLKCDGPAGGFHLVRIRGLGGIWHRLVGLNTLFQGVTQPDAQHLSSEMIEMIGGAELNSFRNALFEIDRIARFVKPTLIKLMLGLIGIKSIIDMIRPAGPKSGVLGYFVAVRADEQEIAIWAGRHARLHRSEAPTISHEHIHLLQFRDSERWQRYPRSPERLLKDEYSGEPYLLYLLKKNEVEARLHECVLSFYRAHHQLPMTVPLFLGMLAASQELGEYVTLILEYADVSFERFPSPHPEREAVCAKELEDILICARSSELTSRFITEVGDFQGSCRVNHSRSLSILSAIDVMFRVEPHRRGQRPIPDLS